MKILRFAFPALVVVGFASLFDSPSKPPLSDARGLLGLMWVDRATVEGPKERFRMFAAVEQGDERFGAQWSGSLFRHEFEADEWPANGRTLTLKAL